MGFQSSKGNSFEKIIQNKKIKYNGRHVYHPMKLYKEERNIFITHPIPLEEISSHQIFNKKNTYIRVILKEN